MSSPLPPVAPPSTLRRDGRDRLVTVPLVLVFFANLLQAMSFFLFVHLPGFLDDLGASSVEIGMLVAATAIAAVFTRPLIGRYIDTTGRRPIALIGGGLNLVVVLLYLTVTTLGPWLYAIRLLHGVAEAILFTALFTMGADIVPASRRTEGLALFGVSGLLPIALGGLIGDLVLADGSFRAVFLTAGGFAIASLVMTMLLSEPVTQRGEGERSGLLGVIRQRDLMPIWWIVGMFSLVLTAYFAFMRTFVDTMGFGTVGLFFAAYSGSAILLRLGFAWLPERVGERRVLFPSLVALILGFVVLAGASSGAHIAVAGALCGIGHGYAFPITFAMVVNRASLEDRGSALGFFTALFDLGTLVGGPLLGAIISLASYEVMFLVCAVVMTVATVIYAVWDSRVIGVPAAA